MDPAWRAPHPAVWGILYLPFGALSGFVSVALTFVASQNGLSVSDGALLTGASLLSQWMKWTWAPVVDITLTPKRWYLIGTAASAVGVATMAAMPMSEEALPALLAVIALASLLNSIVGMAIEAMMAGTVRPEEQGRTSGWFQAGNLGGYGLGGGLGLVLVTRLPAPWMAGAIEGALYLACGLALLAVPAVVPTHGVGHARTVAHAMRGVFADVRALWGTKGGRLSAILCFLPLGTGAAQGVLTQATVAAHWGATETHVAWIQGFLAAGVTAAGCFAGGALCSRVPPRTAYAGIGLSLAAVAVGMAATPPTVLAYVGWSLTYSFGVGLAYAAFTAVVLNAIGASSAATKYNLYASLSNFPIWWLGILLGRIADVGIPGSPLGAVLTGPVRMLLAEAAFGVVAVAVFVAATRTVGRTSLPEVLPAAPTL